ncbi:conserved hypothetical protein [Ramlibacter tataouinensis TTB310]|uniref:Chalcone isomerase domain-containing protein n=2 Tax=Ramlibacter tataouinensis TaxID=94132 RepID=F5Y267_RAMTT|nr:conserved hypothetical protein [Ramlibacter tataouinensis TTB310]
MPAEAQQPPVLAAAVLAQAPAGLQAVGRGRLTFWGLQVYDAVLWAAPGFRAESFEQHALVLELGYLRELEAADIARVSLEQMQRHETIEPAQAQRWQAQLAALLPDVRRGDRLAGLHRPGQGAAFFHNGRAIGEIADARFARLFFAIWLGEATSEPALRQALLGQGKP